MNRSVKIQLGAASVIANALAALVIMSPSSALANPCAPIATCVNGGQCPLAAKCNALAPPGCTLTSMTCTVGCPPPLIKLTCFFS